MFLLRFGVLILLLVSFGAFAEGRRKVTIPWREVPNAEVYEFQLATNPEMDPLTFTRKYRKIQAVIRLKPGTYYFRVRGLDAQKNPGPWTQVEAFAVNPSAPKLISPENKHRFLKPIGDDGVALKWEKGIDDTEYFLEISDKKGVILSRRIRLNQFAWEADRPGVYRWRVGYQSPTGMEWSPKRVFLIARSAMPVFTVEGPTLLERGDLPESWIFGKGIQSVVAYGIDDKDLDVTASAAALVGGIAVEYRWAGKRKPFAPWRWEFTGKAAMFRQVILDGEFYLPRLSFRPAYTKATSTWRMGPFGHLGYKNVSIFVVEENASGTSTQRRSGKANRFGVGGGYKATYYASNSFNMSGQALVRLDLGGESDVIPNKLSPHLGFELGFGIGYFVKKDLVFDASLSLLNESYNWAATEGGTSVISSTFVVLELGLGFRI